MHQVRRQDPRAAKRRDISRSLLPSTSRHGARKALAGLRRADRRAAASALRPLRGAAVGMTAEDDAGGCPYPRPVDPLSGSDLVCGCGFCGTTLPDYPLGEHCYEVSRRRAHDNLGALISWARRQTEGMEPSEARAHLRSLLPDGVIGRHAMSHLLWALDLDPSWSWLRMLGEDEPAVDPRSAIRSLGTWAIAHGRHDELNQQLRRHLAEPTPGHDPKRPRPWRYRLRPEPPAQRPLLGLHDLDAWCEMTAQITEHASVRVRSERHRPWRHLRTLAPVAAWASDLGWREPLG